MSDNRETATVDSSIHLGGGILPEERGSILDQFASLDARLRSFSVGSVTLELSVKERDEPGQRMVLEADIAGWPRLVATSTKREFRNALSEVRDDLIRQITDTKTRSEPRNNRQLRDTES